MDNPRPPAASMDYDAPEMDDVAEPRAPAPAPEAPAPAAPAAPAFVDNISNRASAVKEQVSERMEEAAETVKETMKSYGIDKGRVMSILLGTLVVVAAAGVVGVILWTTMKRGALKTTSYLLEESKSPLLGTEYKKLSGAAIPRAFNGKRMTMSFWIYIHDIQRYTGLYRHVLHRGDKGVKGASPLVFLDRNTNKLHIRFDKIDGSTTVSMEEPYVKAFNEKVKLGGKTIAESVAGTIKDPDAALDLDIASRGITIDYIPLQRWVHVAIVVNEEVNGGIIYAYLDGELVKQDVSNQPVTRKTSIIKTGDSNPQDATFTRYRDLKDLYLDKPGDVYTGGSSVEDVGPGFSGLVSRISFWNHDLNAKDIYNIYQEGPVDNLGAKLGLPAYGVRSPIYRL